MTLEQQRRDLNERILQKKGLAATLFGAISHASAIGSGNHGEALYKILQNLYGEIDMLELQKTVNEHAEQAKARYS